MFAYFAYPLTVLHHVSRDLFNVKAPYKLTLFSNDCLDLL